MAQRDEKGRFLPGNTEGKNSPLKNGLASEMQLRSAASRKRNNTIAAMLRRELEKDGGDGLTRGEVLVAKAAHNHLKGKLTFKDLKDMQDVLGESVQQLRVQHEGIVKVVRSEEEKRLLESMNELDI
jgi:hypothetical protein